MESKFPAEEKGIEKNVDADREDAVSVAPYVQPASAQKRTNWRTAKILVMTDSALKDSADLHARGHFGVAARARNVVRASLKGNQVETVVIQDERTNAKGQWQLGGLRELYDKLSEYRTIEQLVLCFHGSERGVEVGAVGWDLTKVSSLAQELQVKLPTVTKQIDFESCLVGQDPKGIVEFAVLFNAPVATAWTYYGFSFSMSIRCQSGTAANQQRIVEYNAYAEYLMPKSPTFSEAAQNPGTYELLLEGHSRRDDVGSLPQPPANLQNSAAMAQWLEARDKWTKSMQPHSNAKDKPVTAASLEELRQRASSLSDYYQNLLDTQWEYEKLTITFPGR